MDTTRMDKILNINTENMTVTAEAGITCSELGTKLEAMGYYAHTVWAPYYADTLGGMISGVVGGGWSERTQVFGHNNASILGMKVVTPTGSVLETGGGPGTNKNRTTTYMRECGSPDMNGMFIGDAGIFGIKTEVTLSIYPLEKVCKPKSFFFGSFEDIWRAISKLMTLDPFPYTNLMGLGPNAMIKFMQSPTHWGLLCYSRGNSDKEVDDQIKVLSEVCKAAGGTDGSESLDHLAAQSGTGEMVREMGKLGSIGTWMFLETDVPKEDLPRLFKKYSTLMDKEVADHKLEEDRGFRLDVLLPVQRNCCYISTNIYWENNTPESRKKVTEIAQVFNEGIIKDGLFPTTAQRRPADVLYQHWSPAYLEFMRSIKLAMDPNNIINPGHWGLLSPVCK